MQKKKLCETPLYLYELRVKELFLFVKFVLIRVNSCKESKGNVYSPRLTAPLSYRSYELKGDCLLSPPNGTPLITLLRAEGDCLFSPPNGTPLIPLLRAERGLFTLPALDYRKEKSPSDNKVIITPAMLTPAKAHKIDFQNFNPKR